MVKDVGFRLLNSKQQVLIHLLILLFIFSCKEEKSRAIKYEYVQIDNNEVVNRYDLIVEKKDSSDSIISVYNHREKTKYQLFLDQMGQPDFKPNKASTTTIHENPEKVSTYQELLFYPYPIKNSIFWKEKEITIDGEKYLIKAFFENFEHSTLTNNVGYYLDSIGLILLKGRSASNNYVKLTNYSDSGMSSELLEELRDSILQDSSFYLEINQNKHQVPPKEPVW